MKDFEDLTDREVAELTEEELQAYQKMALMEAGCVIPPAPKAPDLVEPKAALRQKVYYQVQAGKGSYKSVIAGAVFETLEQAQAFINLKPFDSDYDYRVGHQYKHAEPLKDPVIEPVTLYEKEDIDKIKPILVSNETKRKEHAEEVQERDKAVESAARITEWITNKWLECRQNQRHYTAVLATFAEYLAMTENDKSVATRFLVKAYGQETLRTVVEWFGENCGLDAALLVEPEEQKGQEP